MGWTACPDAAANKDYFYYAKALGPDWVKVAGKVDKHYCKEAGFLEPEVRSIVHNFTALQAKGVELCQTKFSKPEYKMQAMSVMGGLRSALSTSLKHNLVNVLKNPIKEVKAVRSAPGK